MVKSVKDARKDFLYHAINCSTVTVKSKWATIRNVLHSSKTIVASTKLSAEIFSKYFNDKLSVIASKILSLLVNSSLASIPPPSPPSSFTSFSPVSTTQADALLLALSKPSPLDIVPVLLLKSSHSTFAVILSKLADISFAHGKFPDLYKSSQITPLLKKPSLDSSDPSSFRPISNLRTLGKLLERLAQQQLRPHFLSTPAFSAYQSAYRPFHSTETAALYVSNSLLRSSAPSLLVSLDLSSAFDCVSHSILLDRLAQDFGISALPLSWLCSYLSNRSQFVMWNGQKSLSLPTTSGVPQGSVLGPLLFCAYTSPISRLISLHGLLHHSYADDTTLWLSVEPNTTSFYQLEACSSAMATWFLFNGLQLNPSKSEALLVGTREGRSSVSTSLTSGISLAHSNIPLSSSVKVLGVTFDPALNFDTHISEICKSANYHLKALAHIRNLLSVSSANLIACTIISSRLDYCNSILNGLSSYNLNRLQTIQNRAARIVLGVGRRVSAEPLLRQLHWLPIVQRIKYKTALITFKTLHSHQPSYLSSLLVPYIPSRTLRSSANNFLTSPRVSTVLQSRSFSVAAPHLWNSLPASLRLLANFAVTSDNPVSLTSSPPSIPPNLSTFKRLLKTHLFDQPSTVL